MKPIVPAVVVGFFALAMPAPAAPPSNDTCALAVVIPPTRLPFADTMDTTQATADGDPAVSCVTPAPTKSVWYSFQPTSDDTYAFDTAGTSPLSYAPVLTLYTGTCGGLVPVPNACARGRLTARLGADTTYYLLVSGAGVVVDPTIRIALNGVDLCGGGPGPGGSDCGSSYSVHVGDQLSARVYNQLDNTLLTTGSFSWSLGTNASPATATGPAAAFQYTAPGASTNVVLTWTPAGQSPLVRQVTMNVTAAGTTALGLDALGAIPLVSDGAATIPSPGGTLRLSVQRDAPYWRYAFLVPSVASTVNAAGIPFVSDFSVTNLEPSETIVGLQLWAPDGVRESALITLPAGGSRRIPDVVNGAFGLSQTYGSLLVSSTGFVAAGARTWAPVGAGGTNGQFALAGDVTMSTSQSVLVTSEVGVLPGVRQDSAFRTNVGVYNLGTTDCVVEVKGRDDDGHTVGSKIVLTVPPTRYVQVPLSDATGNLLPSGSVTVTNVTAGCRVGSVAYVIDNVTQDPYAVSQRKRP